MILLLRFDKCVLYLEYISHSCGFLNLIEPIIDDTQITHVIVQDLHLVLVPLQIMNNQAKMINSAYFGEFVSYENELFQTILEDIHGIECLINILIFTNHMQVTLIPICDQLFSKKCVLFEAKLKRYVCGDHL